jgi:hypothetical protein
MPFKIMTPFLLLLLLLSGAGWSADEAKESCELRIYDVQDIIGSIADDHPGPESGLLPKNTPEVAGIFAGMQPTQIHAADLQSLIKDKLLPVQFADPTSSIDVRGAKLIVMQQPPVHAQIEKIIANFRANIKPQIVVKGLLLSVADAPDETYFSDADVDKLRQDAVLLACPRIVCHSTQRTHALAGRGMSYTSDYEISGNDYDPVIATLWNGTIFDVRPVFSTSRDLIRMEVRLSCISNTQLKPAKIGLAADAGPVAASTLPTRQSSGTTETKNEKETTVSQSHIQEEGRLLGGQYAIQLDLDLPSQDANHVKTQVTIPKGKWVLAAALNDQKTPGRKVVLLVSAEALGKK